jgi:hypothetical protein
MPFYSPSTGGFYTPEIHGDVMPADVVQITARKHAALLEAQAQGAEIVDSDKGPVAHLPKVTRADLVAVAVRRIKREARRRILAVASLERQSNDNARLALYDRTDPEFRAASERRLRIDAIRAASNAIEGDAADLDLAALKGFHPAHSSRWP